MWCEQPLLFISTFTQGPSAFYSKIKVAGHEIRMCQKQPWTIFCNEWLDYSKQYQSQ